MQSKVRIRKLFIIAFETAKNILDSIHLPTDMRQVCRTDQKELGKGVVGEEELGYQNTLHKKIDTDMEEQDMKSAKFKRNQPNNWNKGYYTGELRAP